MFNRKETILDEHKKRRKEKILEASFILLGIVLLLSIYELIAYLTDYKVLPELFKSFEAMFIEMGKTKTWVYLGYSLLRLLITLVIVTVLGYLIGLLASYYKPLELVLKPIIYILTSIPTITIILIVVIYTKITSYVIVSLVTFPIIYKASLNGGKMVYEKYKDIMNLEGGKSMNNFSKVLSPLTLPYIFMGLSQASALGLKVELTAEVFISTNTFKGLGSLINLAYINGDFEIMIGLTILAVIFMSLIELLIYLLKTFLNNKFGIEEVKTFHVRFKEEKEN